MTADGGISFAGHLIGCAYHVLDSQLTKVIIDMHLFFAKY